MNRDIFNTNLLKFNYFDKVISFEICEIILSLRNPSRVNDKSNNLRNKNI